MAAGQTVDQPLRYASIPRAALDGQSLGDVLARSGYDVPHALLRPDGWSPEPSEIARLLEKIRRQKDTLGSVAGGGIYRGITPGLTEAFFVDQATRDRLVAEDPICEPPLKRALRGKDIKRWHPSWSGEWLILLKSSENQAWPWANAGRDAERVFARTYPSLHRHLKPMRDALERRQDKGRYWWELRSCSYYAQFEKPKVLYQDISFHSWFSYDDRGLLCNNTCYFMPSEHAWLLAILNSSVMWWYLSRQATHAKDEAFRLHTQFVELLPIPVPDGDAQESLSGQVHELAALAADRQGLQREFLGRLSADLGIAKPSRKLEEFWRLDEPQLAAEVARAAPAGRRAGVEAVVGRSLAPLRSHARTLLARTAEREIQVQQAVFDLYGLTPDEVRLLRATAPPRDPLALVEQTSRSLGAGASDPFKSM